MVRGQPLKYLDLFKEETASEKACKSHSEVDPQFKQVLAELGIKLIYALSPQVKGKVERPYRWLANRIVRTCQEKE